MSYIINKKLPETRSDTDLSSIWKMLQNIKHRELRLDTKNIEVDYIEFLPSLDDGCCWIIFKFDKNGNLISVAS